MLSDEMKAGLLDVIIKAWNNQRGMHFAPEDFNICLEAPSKTSKCTLKVTSKRTDDFFNISVSVNDFGLYNTLGSFRLSSKENFSTGPSDEVQIVDAVLSREQFAKLQRFVTTPNYMFLVNSRRRFYGNPETGVVYGVFGRAFGRA
jgi:hypothetical protein